LSLLLKHISELEALTQEYLNRKETRGVSLYFEGYLKACQDIKQMVEHSEEVIES
jgi:hypothetical protein